MKYVDPYVFLTALTGGPLPDHSRESLLLARKKAFAEVELSDTQTVQVNGVPYTKNDLLVFFDGLQIGGQLAFHDSISKDPVLLQLLTEGTLRRNGKFSAQVIYQDPAFLAFISPYFETAYTTLVLRCIDQQDTRTLADLRENPVLMLESNKASSFERIQRPLQRKIERLKDIRDEIVALKGPLLSYVIPGDLEANAGIYSVAIFNLLPDTFQSLRDSYAVSMINVAVTIRQFGQRQALEVLTNNRQLKCSDYWHQENEKRYEALKDQLERAAAIQAGRPTGGKTQRPIISMLFIGLFLLRLLLLMAHCR